MFATEGVVVLVRMQRQKVGIGQKVITHYRQEKKGDIFWKAAQD